MPRTLQRATTTSARRFWQPLDGQRAKPRSDGCATRAEVWLAARLSGDGWGAWEAKAGKRQGLGPQIDKGSPCVPGSDRRLRREPAGPRARYPMRARNPQASGPPALPLTLRDWVPCDAGDRPLRRAQAQSKDRPCHYGTKNCSRSGAEAAPSEEAACSGSCPAASKRARARSRKARCPRGAAAGGAASAAATNRET